MSHFAVLVATEDPSEETLTKTLQPYHEYECTGIKDEYVVFVDCHDEVLTDWNTKTETRYKSPDPDDNTRYTGDEPLFYREPTDEEMEKISDTHRFGHINDGLHVCRKDWHDGQGYRPKVYEVPEGFEKVEVSIQTVYDSMEEFAEKYHGYDQNRDGRIGRMTNPNRKWDWWVVGGRWSNSLLLKDGNRVDQAQKSDVDFETDIKMAEDDAAEKYDEVMNIIDGRNWHSWKHVRDEMFPGEIEVARNYYREQPVVKDFIEASNDHWFESVDDYSIDRGEYIRQAGLSRISTFAVLYDGTWLEKGKMGWWACVSNEDEEWEENYQTILDIIPDNYYLTIVDCHI